MNADLWYARALAGAARKTADSQERARAWQQALLAAVHAVDSSDNAHNAWYNLALFFGAQNDAAGAERALRRAILAAPNWYKPHWLLAETLLRTGRTELALAESAAAVDLNGGRNQEVLRTAAHIRERSGM
jgi:tetratricopeptide (TPR) repeat protein